MRAVLWMFTRSVIFPILCFVFSHGYPQTEGSPSDADRLTLALTDPGPAISAYPNAPQSRQNSFATLLNVFTGIASSGMGALGASAGVGGPIARDSSGKSIGAGDVGGGFFSGMFSGLSGFAQKIGALMGAPPIPADLQKTLSDGPRSPTPMAGFAAPRMSKPGPEAFKRAEARKKKLKGRAKRQAVSVKSMKQLQQAVNTSKESVNDPLSAGVSQFFQAFMGFLAGFGKLQSTPVNKWNDHIDKLKNEVGDVQGKLSELPNTVFGMLRSRREAGPPSSVTAQSGDDADNEIRDSVIELAVAHQENWFTYLRSFNGSTVECHEWDFCRTAKGNTVFKTEIAKNGGKLLSYLTSNLRDENAKRGPQLTQAVECCLSPDLTLADSCEDFYHTKCLESDPEFILERHA